MRNKILLIDSDVKTKLLFEEALEHFVAEGGELFVADHLNSGLEVAEQEHPQLVFVSTQVIDFDQTALTNLNASIILLSQEELIKNRYPTITKPVKSQSIMKKCSEVFTHPSTNDVRPM